MKLNLSDWEVKGSRRKRAPVNVREQAMRTEMRKITGELSKFLGGSFRLMDAQTKYMRRMTDALEKIAARSTGRR